MSKYLSKISKNKKKRHIVALPLDLFHTPDDWMRIWHGNDKIDGYNIPIEQQYRLFPEMEKYNPEVVCNDEITKIIN